MIFKVDLEKAYDSVSWEYLLTILEFMGFVNKWIGWISARLNSSRASVLVNGSPTVEFNLQRGLRQGDPLSTFLFIIAMEGLHVAMEDAVVHGFFHGALVGEDGLVFSHLFMQMMLFLGEWDEENITNLVRILNCFYLVFGLKIKLQKSNLFEIGVLFVEVENLAVGTGCSAKKLPFLYLGLPIDLKMRRVEG